MTELDDVLRAVAPAAVVEALCEKRDYSLLRPFDLEAAKRGELVCTTDGREMAYVSGPDSAELIVVEDKDGTYHLRSTNKTHKAPLCWVEGRQVYRGDVLWHRIGKRMTILGRVEDDPNNDLETDSTRCNSENLTWTPPKVKREGWVNIYSACNSDTVAVVSNAHPSKYHADKSTGSERRIACVRIEWEEPAEVAK